MPLEQPPVPVVPAEPALTIAEVAELLRVGETLVRTLIKNGDLLAVKFHDKLRVPVRAYQAYLDALTREAEAERRTREAERQAETLDYLTLLSRPSKARRAGRSGADKQTTRTC